MTHSSTETVGVCDYTFAPGPSVVEPVLDCKMRCNGCGVKIQFPVIARRAGEDVLKFMERAQQVAGQVHSQVSPACKHTTCDLQLPLQDGAKGIGEVAKS